MSFPLKDIVGAVFYSSLINASLCVVIFPHPVCQAPKICKMVQLYKRMSWSTYPMHLNQHNYFSSTKRSTCQRYAPPLNTSSLPSPMQMVGINQESRILHSQWSDKMENFLALVNPMCAVLQLPECNWKELSKRQIRSESERMPGKKMEKEMEKRVEEKKKKIQV